MVYESAAWTPASTSPVFRDPQAEPPAAPTSVLDHPADGPLHRERGTYGPLRVVSWATAPEHRHECRRRQVLSTLPPKAVTAWAHAAITRSVTAPTRSGSSCSTRR